MNSIPLVSICHIESKRLEFNSFSFYMYHIEIMGIEFNSLSFYMYHIQTTVIELNSSSFSSSFHFQIGM